MGKIDSNSKSHHNVTSFSSLKQSTKTYTYLNIRQGYYYHW